MHSASVMNNEIYFYNFYYNEIDPLQRSLSFPITYEEGLIIYISTFISLEIKFYLFILVFFIQGYCGLGKTSRHWIAA
jgi:hypothetical protein